MVPSPIVPADGLGHWTGTAAKVCVYVLITPSYILYAVTGDICVGADTAGFVAAIGAPPCLFLRSMCRCSFISSTR